MIKPQRTRRLAVGFSGAFLIVAAAAATATPAHADESGPREVTVCNRIVGNRCVETTRCLIWPTGEWQCSDGTVSDRLPPIYDH